jgi:multiple sugar transport system ATP-binding protein
MSSLALRNIAKRYGDTTIIQSLDLEVEDGQFVALVGPSGCGKSTLLRMIAGLEDVSGGDVFIGGKRVNDDSPKARNIAMVFQNYALYPHMSVRENMGLNLKISGMSKTDIEQRVNNAATLLDILDLLDRRPSQLSGGQRQRVAMGRAIVRDPAVFLFDEPLSNLDAKLRVQMRGEIKALHKKVQTTAIYVTHDQIEAMTLADRVVVMNKGRIEQQGTPLELYLHPANLFVAGFIGSPAMNFLPATLEKQANETTARLSDGSAIALLRSPNAQAGTSVILGIRPEHVQLGGPSGSLSGTIDYLEPTGAQTQVSLAVANQNLVAVTEGIFQHRPDESIAVHLPAASIHLFDAATGNVLAWA